MFLGGSCSARLWIARESLLFFPQASLSTTRPRPINVDFVGFPLHHAEAMNLQVFSPRTRALVCCGHCSSTRGEVPRGKGASRHPLLFLSGYKYRGRRILLGMSQRKTPTHQDRACPGHLLLVGYVPRGTWLAFRGLPFWCFPSGPAHTRGRDAKLFNVTKELSRICKPD